MPFQLFQDEYHYEISMYLHVYRSCTLKMQRCNEAFVAQLCRCIDAQMGVRRATCCASLARLCDLLVQEPGEFPTIGDHSLVHREANVQIVAVGID